MATFSFLYYFFLLPFSLLLVSITEAGTKLVNYELLKYKNIDGVKRIENSTASKPDADPAARCWCVAKAHVGKATLQKVLDYACGAGADCGPTIKSGVCYEPNTLLAHASYAVNSYYKREVQASGSCDFNSAAHVVTKRPKFGNCEFP